MGDVRHEPGGTSKKNGNIKSLLLSITVEPLVLFYILPSTMNRLITQNLFLEKSCRLNLGYSESVCDSIMEMKHSGYTKKQQLEVHKLASEMITIKTIIHGIIPLVLIFFLGSWSDKHMKRKPCILGPIIGELVAVSCLILDVVFRNQLPVLLTSLAYSLPMAISGGWPCLFLGVYSYVTMHSNEKNLITKIGGVSTTHHIAVIIGIGISGLMLNLVGFIGAYTTTFFMMLSSLVYGYYIIKDRKLIINDIEEDLKQLEKSPKNLIKDFFHKEHFLKTAEFCFRKGPNNRRLRMLAIIFLLVAVNGPLHGEQSVVYLYTKFKFGWREMDFAIFYGVQFASQILGSLIALILLSKYLKWKDETLGILALISSASACTLFAFAKEGSLFYAGAALDIFSGTSHIALRTLMSKIVPAQEIGTMNSVFEICNSLIHLAFGTIYIILYKHFLHIFPGTVFLVSSSLKCIGILIFIWLYDQSNKIQKNRSSTAAEIETKEELTESI